MAESVDAPVSNTGGAIHPGSIPGPGTANPLKLAYFQRVYYFYEALTKHKITKHIYLFSLKDTPKPIYGCRPFGVIP